MKIPANLKYTESHEWVKSNEDGTITIGITDHAQELLGDMVFVQLPNVGDAFEKGDDCAVLESVKSAADVYAPVAGTVIAVNEELSSAPERINNDAFSNWIWKMCPDDEGAENELLSDEDYQNIISEN